MRKAILSTSIAGLLVLTAALPAQASVVPTSTGVVKTSTAQVPPSESVVSPMLPGEVQPAVLPVIPGAVLLACVGSVGLATYQSFTGGDPVEFLAGALIGCIPAGAIVGPAIRPAIVAAINAARPAVVSALRAAGVPANAALILALEGSS